MIKQYNIYEINLDGTIRDDIIPDNIIAGVILSPDVMNDCLKSVIIAPITSCPNASVTPTTFFIDKNNKIRLDQISSLSKKRVQKHLGEVSISQLPKIKKVLNEMLVK